MTTTAFLTELDRAVRQLLATVQTGLEPLTLAQLNQQPAPNAWSALECLEHLNRYSRYYNPRFAQVLSRPDTARGGEVRYSWVGRKFLGMMSPTNTKKVKTFRYMNPAGSQLGHEVLAEFYAHQQQLLELLAGARCADLNRKAIAVEFLRILKMRLGEAFELQVLHEQRHVQQALRAVAGAQAPVAAGAVPGGAAA